MFSLSGNLRSIRWDKIVLNLIQPRVHLKSERIWEKHLHCILRDKAPVNESHKEMNGFGANPNRAHHNEVQPAKEAKWRYHTPSEI